jgi:predicted transcriptional regulator
MSKTAVITARIEPELSDRLDQLARDYDRSRGWLVAQAIERYVAEESQFLALIKEGEADIEAGRVFTQEEVEAMFGVKRDQRDAA